MFISKAGKDLEDPRKIQKKNFREFWWMQPNSLLIHILNLRINWPIQTTQADQTHRDSWCIAKVALEEQAQQLL